jgi:sugar lactone lactonase YvrE
MSPRNEVHGPHDVSIREDDRIHVIIGLAADPALRPAFGPGGADFGKLVRLRRGGWRPVADVSAYEAAVNPGGGIFDSNPYGLLARKNGWVVAEAGGNSLLRVARDGSISTLAIFPSRAQGRSTDSVPTAVALGPDGAYYVGELTGGPFSVGAASIYRVVPGQAPEVFLTGFTTIIDLTFGPDGSLYVLQFATGPMLSGPGALIRVSPDGTRTTLASAELTNPMSVVVGPAEIGEELEDDDDEEDDAKEDDDEIALYVSNRGTSVGTGEVLRMEP